MEKDPAVEGLNVYIVGGAVRDQLLGLSPGDKDWLVVGATPEQLLQRGFIAVGADFPVFLHPKTKQEYALARTERKSGVGYKGFTFYTGTDVTIEEDLKRRDLTINAIAQAKDHSLIDPFNGQADIQNKLFRHVGEAFVEDPVRVLRLARFATRFPDFSVAPETIVLCQQMVANGEVDALVAERVWKELSRALEADKPSRAFEVLHQVDALALILPGLLFNHEKALLVDVAAQLKFSLAQRYALLSYDAQNPKALSNKIRASNECAEMAVLLAGAINSKVHKDQPESVLGHIEKLDGLRKPERFLALMQVLCLFKQAQANELSLQDNKDWLSEKDFWQKALNQIKNIDAQAIALQLKGNPQAIKHTVRQARLDALVSVL